MVNVEVVRLRARPGADAGGAAPFAESAAGELERAAALVGALVGLSRGARHAGSGPADVALVLQQVVTLLAPALVHQGVVLTVESGAPAVPTAAPLTAVRLAVASALLAAGSARDRPTGGGRSPGVASGGVAEVVGSDPADEPASRLRCTLRLASHPELRLDGGPDRGTAGALALPDAGDRAVLSAVGIDCARDGDAVVLRFPPAASAV